MGQKANAKILIVDDQEAMTETLKDILEDKGYKTIVAYTGTQALKKSSNKNIKIILMDVKLPDINGVEAFIKIKEKNPRINVIMMTAFSVEDLLRKAKQEGAYGVLYKPIKIKTMMQMIGELLS